MSDQNAPLQQKAKKKNIPVLPGMIKYGDLRSALKGVTKEMEALHNIVMKSGG